MDGETVNVTWVSSKPAVITDKDMPIEDIGIDEYRVKAAGVVTRQNADTDVTLTATLKCGEASDTKVFDATVKAKPEEKVYSAYAFSSFPSNHEEQVYLAVGKDPLHFTDLNGGKPILTSTVGNLAIRDPYIVRSHEGDRFYLIATDLRAGTPVADGTPAQGFGDSATLDGSKHMVVWQSDDLVNWSDAALTDCGAIEYEKNQGYWLGCVYAPEAIYDEVTGDYAVYWASRWYPYYSEENPNKTGRKYKIFVSRTRDFVNFSEAKLYMDYEGNGVGAIDMTMVRATDGRYFRISADGDMNIQTADYVAAPWSKVSDITTLHKKMNGYEEFSKDFTYNGEPLLLTGGRIEGPELFKFNGEEKYGLYADNYQMPGAGYIPMIASDLSDATGSEWQLYGKSDFSWGYLRKRHGGITPITQDEYDALVAKYGLYEPETTE